MPPSRPLTGLDGLHACPKRGCPDRLPRSTLACRRHWYSLPFELRQRINSHWRAHRYADYLAARDEAVSFLNGA